MIEFTGPLLYCAHGRLALVATDLVEGTARYKFDLQFTISLCPTFYDRGGKRVSDIDFKVTEFRWTIRAGVAHFFGVLDETT